MVISGRAQSMTSGSTTVLCLRRKFSCFIEMEAELPEQSVTSAKLSPALSDLIDGNGSLEQALPAGSVIARKPDEAPPPGYTLFNAMNTTPLSSGKRRHRLAWVDMPMTVLN